MINVKPRNQINLSLDTQLVSGVRVRVISTPDAAAKVTALGFRQCTTIASNGETPVSEAEFGWTSNARQAVWMTSCMKFST